MEEDKNNQRGSVVQNIHAPVYGHVAAGDITIIEQTMQQERELTWWDLSDAELYRRLKIATTTRWQAWRNYWFNTPFFLLMLLCLGLLWWALQLLSHSLSTFPFAPSGISPIWFVALNGCIMTSLTYWLQKIRRVEANVAADAQAEIDAIEFVLRKRKYTSR